MNGDLRFSWRDFLALVAITISTIAAYWPVGSHDFVNYDDPAYVAANPIVQEGITLAGIKWAFTTGDTGNWHPLTWLSHMFDCELFGLNPGAHHWMSVAIHVVNSLVLFLLLRQLLASFWIAICVAGLFALHPLHVESVAWISERKDVLSTLFGLLSIWAYVNAVRRNTRLLWTLVPLLFALSLLAKPMLVTLPCVLLLLDFWPLQRSRFLQIGLWRRNEKGHDPANANLKIKNHETSFLSLVLEKQQLFLMAIASCIITFLVQHQGGAMKLLESLPWHERIANAMVSYARYLGKTIWPVDLAVVYPHPGHWPTWLVIGSLAVLVLVTALALKVAKMQPHLIVGWLWFLGTLVPVIGIVQVGPQAMADRYTYVSLIGVFLLLTCAISRALNVLKSWREPVAALLGVAALSACFEITRSQVRVWADTETLYEMTLAVTEKNWLVHSNLGVYLEGQGRFAEALDQFDQAVAIQPEHPQLQFYRANELFRLKQVNESIVGLMRTLQLNADHVEALNLLAWTRATSPDDALRNGIEAVRLAERSNSLNTKRESRHLATLAAAYAAVGRFNDAIRTGEESLKLAMKENQPEQANATAIHLQEYRAGRALRLED